MRNFDVFFDLCLEKRLSKQSICRWSETPSRILWCQCNVLAFAGPVLTRFVSRIHTVYTIMKEWQYMTSPAVERPKNTVTTMADIHIWVPGLIVISHCRWHWGMRKVKLRTDKGIFQLEWRTERPDEYHLYPFLCHDDVIKWKHFPC